MIITTMNDRQIEGELIGVKQDALLVLDSASSADRSIAMDDIKVICVAKGLPGIGLVPLGILAGGFIGGIVMPG